MTILNLVIGLFAGVGILWTVSQLTLGIVWLADRRKPPRAAELAAADAEQSRLLATAALAAAQASAEKLLAHEGCP
jgi:phage terminase Nu1 subunit (DNA packaging protein)